MKTEMSSAQKSVHASLKKNIELQKYIRRLNFVRGRGYCDDVFYWRGELLNPIKIEFKGYHMDYTHVHFMPYSISGNIRKLAKCVQKPERPNIDLGTGNTHIKKPFNRDKWECEGTIKQIVLVSKNNPANQYGPLFYVGEWSSLEKMDCIGVVPKTCYYPLINFDDIKIATGSNEYQQLEKIWKAIKDLTPNR